jgi:hypothetical protein
VFFHILSSAASSIGEISMPSNTIFKLTLANKSLIHCTPSLIYEHRNRFEEVR